MWRILAAICAWPPIAQWLIKRAKRTPYSHITSADGADLYMGRWWLFNAYRWDWLPSIRVHHICRADQDPHLHDHPWDARTIILAGHYVEQREDGCWAARFQGDTAAIKHGEFHRIALVPTGGVWTLFFTWRYRGTWGFLVDGAKVPYREYLRLP